MNSHIQSQAGMEFPVVRRSAIVERLNNEGVVRTLDLAKDLHVSVETIRRDLAELEREGVLERIHGGATLASQRLREEPSFRVRTQVSEPAKASIAKRAVDLIPDGATVMVDVRTTALSMAAALPDTFRGIVVTNSLPAANELARHPHIELLVTGGRVRSEDLAISGSHAMDLLSSIRADIAFIGSGGVSVSGITDFHLDEVATRRIMINNSVKTYVLADSSKHNCVAPFHVSDWEDVTGMITDNEPPLGLRAAMEEAGAEVLVGTEERK